MPQNSPELRSYPGYTEAIDGIGMELFFQATDRPCTEDYCAENLANARALRDAGKPVFAVDYATRPTNIRSACAQYRKERFVGYVGVLELDRISPPVPERDEGVPTCPRPSGSSGWAIVGLTLTAALARAGNTVFGVDVQPAVRESLARGRPLIFEPGGRCVREMVGSTILIGDELPAEGLDAAVICVSTPIDEATHQPNLANLAAAARDIARWCSPDTLVVVRSTVPSGPAARGAAAPA